MRKKDFRETMNNILDMSDTQETQQLPETKGLQDAKTDRRFRKNPNLVTCSFRTDKDMKEELETLAWQQRTTISAIINNLIKEYLAKQEK